MTRGILLTAALVWSASPARALPRPKKAAPAAVPVLSTAAALGSEYSLSEGRFALRPPKDWASSRDPKQDERQKTFGATFTGPRSDDGILSVIDVAYYPPDNAVFPGGAAEYLKRNHNDDPLFVQPIGQTITPVEKVVLGGKNASRFTRLTKEFPPAHPTGVETVEEVRVVPVSSGFYVVTFRCSRQLREALDAAVARSLATLHFTAPKR